MGCNAGKASSVQEHRVMSGNSEQSGSSAKTKTPKTQTWSRNPWLQLEIQRSIDQNEHHDNPVVIHVEPAPRLLGQEATLQGPKILDPVQSYWKNPSDNPVVAAERTSRELAPVVVQVEPAPRLLGQEAMLQGKATKTQKPQTWSRNPWLQLEIQRANGKCQ